jgi:hypothetical protein
MYFLRIYAHFHTYLRIAIPTNTQPWTGSDGRLKTARTRRINYSKTSNKNTNPVDAKVQEMNPGGHSQAG